MNEEQLKTLLNHLFDSGRNAEYRVKMGIYTQSDAMKKQEKDVAEALKLLKGEKS